MGPNVLVIIPCCCVWLAAGRPQQWTYRLGSGSGSDDVYRRPSIYDPLEVVDFELMAEPPQPSTTTTRGSAARTQYNYNNGHNFGGRNKYDLVVEPAVVTNGGGRSRSYRLPLLSRGERDIMDEEEEEEDNNLWQDEEDEEEVPSCQELRRMWRIARRIHHRAIKTNKIPQETGHPFAEFESDRYGVARVKFFQIISRRTCL
jgi:hypothetical protein